MDRYREGIKHYFEVARKFSPFDFDRFKEKWFSHKTEFTGYNQSNFNLYIELSKYNNIESDIFIFSPTSEVERFTLNRLEKKITKTNLLVDNNNAPNYSDFQSIHKPVFMKKFNLSQIDNYILSEKITLALCDMGLYDDTDLEYTGIEMVNPFNKILDLGEGIIINLD